MMHAAVACLQLEVVDGGARIVARVVTDKRMYRDRLAAPPIQQEIAKVLRELHGADARVDFQVDAAGAAAAGAAAAPRILAKDAQPGPAAKRVLDKFRGRIVQVNPEDRLPPAPPADANVDDAPVEDVPPPPED